MCGIAGIIHRQPTPGLEQKWGDRLRQTISQRGPDGHGVYADDFACLVHTRLSIIDLASGAQPLWSADGRHVIIYNGEFFNYAEVRKELAGAHGYEFKTQSDTEVLLAAYQVWGKDFLSRVDGEFAAVIYEPAAQSLFLFRDRFGIRPLYYRLNDGELAFGSSIKSVVVTSREGLRFDNEKLQQQFLTWAPPVGESPYIGVSELPPGHFAQIDTRTWRFDLKRYWAIPFNVDAPHVPSRQVTEELEHTLLQAIERRLVADVEVGAYLSGGIDSAYICSEVGRMRKKSGGKLHTFSIEFGDPAYDESTYQRAVAEHIGSEHRPLRVTDELLMETFPRAVASAEIPCFRLAFVPMFLLSKMVRESGIKCVLSGEGADELLYGYEIFKEFKIRQFWNRQPDSKMRPQAMRGVYHYLPSFSPRYMNLTLEYYRKHQANLGLPLGSHSVRWDSYQYLNMFFERPRWKTPAAAHEEIGAGFLKDVPSERRGTLGEARRTDVMTLLQGYLLSTQGDRMAMAHAVEARPVYLSHVLWEKMARYPTSNFVLGRQDKIPLRKLARPVLPEKIATRPKNPYRAPDAYAILRSKNNYVQELLTERTLQKLPFLNAKRVIEFAGFLSKKPVESISSKESAALTFLLTTVMLNEKHGARADEARDC